MGVGKVVAGPVRDPEVLQGPVIRSIIHIPLMLGPTRERADAVD